MDALGALACYEDDTDAGGGSSSTAAKQRPKATTAIAVRAAPEVGSLESAGVSTPMVSNDAKVVKYNPKYEALWAVEQGPKNPFYVDGITPGMRNTLGGSIERTNIADFHFEEQAQTFDTFGFAMDPSAAADSSLGSDVVGNREMWATMQGRTVHQVTKRDLKKRKLEDTAAEKVLEGRGTALTEEEAAEVAKDLEDAEAREQAARDERIAERKAREKGMPEATSQFHAKADTDYQGRTWIECPSDLKRQSELASVQSYIPKNCVHTWTGHTAGVHAIRWFPKTGHLLLSASMDNKVKIWDVYNNRKCMRTYNGHTKPVRDVTFSQDGRQFVSAGYDRVVRYWDTETGACLNAWKAKGIPYQAKIHPGDENILAACSDKNIVQWDPRQSTDDSLVQEYIQHLGSVNTINFYDDYRRVVSTGDDKKLFVWEYGIGTAPMKHVAEPWMHSMPAMTPAPCDDGSPKFLLGQSLDNQILVYQCGERFKLNKKKHFVGHTVAGYACQIGVSPDMKYVISGDGDGRLWLWDWKSTKMYRKIKAHDGVCIGAIWHPVEQSKVATCGWDGLIKFWD